MKKLFFVLFLIVCTVGLLFTLMTKKVYAHDGLLDINCQGNCSFSNQGSVGVIVTSGINVSSVGVTSDTFQPGGTMTISWTTYASSDTGLAAYYGYGIYYSLKNSGDWVEGSCLNKRYYDYYPAPPNICLDSFHPKVLSHVLTTHSASVDTNGNYTEKVLGQKSFTFKIPYAWAGKTIRFQIAEGFYQGVMNTANYTFMEVLANSGNYSVGTNIPDANPPTSFTVDSVCLNGEQLLALNVKGSAVAGRVYSLEEIVNGKPYYYNLYHDANTSVGSKISFSYPIDDRVEEIQPVYFSSQLNDNSGTYTIGAAVTYPSVIFPNPGDIVQFKIGWYQYRYIPPSSQTTNTSWYQYQVSSQTYYSNSLAMTALPCDASVTISPRSRIFDEDGIAAGRETDSQQFSAIAQYKSFGQTYTATSADYSRYPSTISDVSNYNGDNSGWTVLWNDPNSAWGKFTSSLFTLNKPYSTKSLGPDKVTYHYNYRPPKEVSDNPLRSSEDSAFIDYSPGTTYEEYSNKPVELILTADPHEICPGQSSKINWEITGFDASKFTIDSNLPIVNNSPLKGEMTVTPDGDVGYYINISGDSGSTSQYTSIFMKDCSAGGLKIIGDINSGSGSVSNITVDPKSVVSASGNVNVSGSTWSIGSYSSGKTLNWGLFNQQMDFTINRLINEYSVSAKTADFSSSPLYLNNGSASDPKTPPPLSFIDKYNVKPEGKVWVIDNGNLVINNSTTVYGVGTIILKNGNLIINQNINYGTDGKNSLGFIVLKGNVEIGSNVSALRGAYYVPNGRITFNTPQQNSIFMGDFIGKEITLPNSNNKSIVIQYDSNIVDNPPPGFGDLIAPTWGEKVP